MALPGAPLAATPSHCLLNALMTVTERAAARRSPSTRPAPRRAAARGGGPVSEDVLLHAFEARCRAATTVRAAVLLEPEVGSDALRLRATWPAGVSAPVSMIQASAEACRGSRPVVRALDAMRPDGAQVFATRVRRGGRVLGLVSVLLDGAPEERERDLRRWLALVDVPVEPATRAQGGSARTAGPAPDGRPTPGPTPAPTPAPAAGPAHGPSPNPTHDPSPRPTQWPTQTPARGAPPGPPPHAGLGHGPGHASTTVPAPRSPTLVQAPAGAPVATAGRILECQAALFDADGLEAALQALLAELAERYDCTRVGFGWADPAGTQVVALSHNAADRITREASGPLATAMDEAIDQQACLTWPGIPGRDAPIVVAQAQLARLAQAAAVCSVPLAWRGEPVGALTLERAAPFNDATLVELGRVAAFLAPLLALERQAEQPLRNLRRRAWARLFGPRRRAGVVLVAVVLLGAALAFVPVPDRVAASARVEGAVQRTLTAPVDGWLMRVHVRPGDAVKADEVLVELDDRDLALERLRWATEAEQADRQATEAIAREDRGQFAGHAARAAQARAQLALVDAQLARQRVRAPFDGIVLAGDLTQSLGAPVRAGDTLLSVAPAGRHRVIVEVDERDVARVAKGAVGELALTAHAGRRVPIEVTRISPAAVARDGRNVFEVEAHPRVETELRPGYQGVAKLDADARPLVRTLLERPWRAIAQRLWAWGW